MKDDAGRLGLGTVQFGMDYGISGIGAAVAKDEVLAILREAKKAAISVLDTAPAYGRAEKVLGELLPAVPHSWRIISKLPAPKSDGRTLEAALRPILERSLRDLGLRTLDGLLVHDSAAFLSAEGERLYHLLRKWRAEGLVRKIGVSVYTPAETERLFERYDLDIVQFPINVFNQSFLSSGVLAALHGRGVELHARSVFLQGLLLMPFGRVPPRFAGHEKLRLWHAMLKRARCSALAASLAFVRRIGEIDHVIIGVHGVEQLRECLAAWRTTCDLDFAPLASLDAALTDPRTW